MFQKFFLALTAFLCAFAIPSVGTPAADSDIIENNEAGIPNKALYESILKKLMKDPVGTFTEGEAKSISFLYHNASDGGSLKGIGHLSALEDLELEYYKPVNVKQSLEGIDELTGLKRLEIDGNHKIQMKDLNSLKGMDHLESLGVNRANVKSLQGVEGLVGLRYLGVECNQLSSLEGIEHLKGLKGLYAQSNSISSLRGIEGLGDMEVLDVRYNDITSVKELRGLKKLTRLYLADNYLKNADPIKNLTELFGLYLEANQLSRLPNMKKLTKLYYGATEFAGNRLSKNELMKKLPAHLLKKKGWLNRQKRNQKINGNSNIRISAPKNQKVTASTKRIEGYVSKKWKSVQLVNLSYIIGEVYIDECDVKSVKPDKDGRFVMKGLNLKKYKGQKLRIYLNGIYPTKFQFVVK